MSLAASAPVEPRPVARADGWIALLAFGLLAVPTVLHLAGSVWGSDQQGHGPIVLMLCAWLFWRQRTALGALPARVDAGRGWMLLLGLSLPLWVIGRSVDILLFEVGALIPVAMALLWALWGRASWRVLAFPLFFMVFLVPLPGVVVDTLTQPMKLGVSWVAEALLRAVGYPIARSGVILQIGQYQLLVADACAGLHTLFTLEAMGLLYLNLVRHHSLARNLFLALIIAPVSFAANVIRVVTLCLVTYHLGDAAGQGFLHGAAGVVLFVAALGLIMAGDALVRWVLRRRRKVAA